MRSPIDLAAEILEWVEAHRPSEYPPWRDFEVRDLGILISRWDADQQVDVFAERDRLREQRDGLLKAANTVLDWLSSFSMPPTSTIAEKEEMRTVLVGAIARVEGKPS